MFFCPKNKSSPNSLKFGPEVHCYVFISNLMGFFSKFCHSYFLGATLVPKSEILQIDWNFVQGYIAICLYDFNVYSIFQKFLSFICFDKFSSKIWSFPNWLKVYTGVHCNMLITVLMFIFSKFCRIILVKFGLKI